MKEIKNIEQPFEYVRFNEESTTKDISEKIYNKFLEWQETIVRKKFKEKGFADLLENIGTNTFNRVTIKKSDNCEKWYVDNGTPEGLLIVTFEKMETNIINDFDATRTITTAARYIYY